MKTPEVNEYPDLKEHEEGKNSFLVKQAILINIRIEDNGKY